MTLIALDLEKDNEPYLTRLGLNGMCQLNEIVTVTL